MKIIVAALLFGIASATMGYIPPYTDEDMYDDTDESAKDNKEGVHDEEVIGLRPKYCQGLALSEAHNLGPYQAGVVQGLIHELQNDLLSL